MEVTKIRLSKAELEMVSNSELILTKNRIIRIAICLLEAAMGRMQFEAGDNTGFPFNNTPKISKGENYEGLPFAILDYPRIADAGALCFVRSMFWWGNFFSSTLHLSGKYKIAFERKVIDAYQLLSDREYFVCVSDEQWGHHFRNDNYKEIRSFLPAQFEELVRSALFIKIAKKHSLSEWEEIELMLFNNWRFLSGLVSEAVK